MLHYRHFLILLFWCFLSNIEAQIINYQQLIDSLVKVEAYSEANLYCHKLLSVYKNQQNWTAYVQTVAQIADNRVELDADADSTLRFLEQATLSIKQELLQPLDTLYYKQGIAHYYLEQYVEAIEDFTKALSIRISAQDTTSIAQTCYVMAVVHKEAGNYETAIDLLLKAASMRDKTKELEALGHIYYELGWLYENIGDNEQALNYYNTTATIFKTDTVELVGIYERIGLIYSEQKDSIGIPYLEKALAIYLSLYGFEDEDVARVYQHLGYSFLEWEQYDEAEIAYNKALKILISIYSTESDAVAMVYNQKGLIRKAQGNYKEALSYFQQSLDIEQAVYPNQFYHAMAGTYSNLGETHFALGDQTNALRCYQFAIACQVPTLKAVLQQNLDKLQNLKVQEPLPLHPLSDMYISGSEEILLETLANEGAVYDDLYKKYDDTIYLSRALILYESAIDFMAILRQQYRTKAAKQILLEKKRAIYERAIDIVWLLYEKTPKDIYVDKAFKFIEQGKALLLREALQEDKARGKISFSIQEQERQLSNQITLYRKNIYTAELENNEKELKVYRKKLFDLEEQKKVFIKDLEQKFPAYYAIKYSEDTTGLYSLQNYLATSNKTLIEYFIGESSNYAIIANQHKSYLVKLKGLQDLDKQITQLKRSLNDIYGIFNQAELYDSLYIHHARNLYQILLAPLLERLPIAEKSELTIIPDGLLYYIPFEVLLRDSVEEINYKTLPYIAQYYKTSYYYSSSLLIKLKQLETSELEKLNFLGFAPYYTNNPLPNAVSEIASVYDIIDKNAEKYINKAANKAAFKKAIEERLFSIVHFAGHAVLHDKNPLYSHLLFSDKNSGEGMLTLSELYDLELKTDLVILTACNSGDGKLEAGEGLISLSRAFANIGVASSIISLWTVDDKNAQNLIKKFYNGINTGASKTDALYKARLAYLTDIGEGEPHAHPYFWSGLVLFGNTEAINFTQTKFDNVYIYSICIICFLGMITFFLYKKGIVNLSNGSRCL